MPLTPIALTGSPYSQTFDTLTRTGSQGASQLPQGWGFAELASGDDVLLTDFYLTADDGSSPIGDTYSYGANGGIDRAFGEQPVNSFHSILGAEFVNDTDRYIANVTISYTREQWRSGGGHDQLDFQYSYGVSGTTSLTTGTHWQDFNALDFVAPNTTTSPGAVYGNTFANQEHLYSTFTVGLAPGTTLFLRWVPSDTAGTGNGLAIDNFSITTTFYPIPPRNDLNGDHHADILWHNDNGAVSIWDSGQIDHAHIISGPGNVSNSWQIAGTGDFDGNGISDILWRNGNGAASIWFNSDINHARIITDPIQMSTSWHIAGTGDFNGSGTSDVLWQNDNGAIEIWDAGNYTITDNVAPGVVAASWHIAGTGDFDGSGSTDILWRNDNGAVSIWDSGQIDRAHIVSAAGVVGNDWHIAGTGDFNGDGKSDILWRNDNGAASIWDSGQINGAHIIAAAGDVPTSWHVADTGDYDANGHTDILWRNDNGAASI